MSDRLRTGVIGCGLISQTQHLPNLRSLSGLFELSAVCDLDLARARRCAERFGAKRAYPGAADLFENEKLDAVIIATSGDHAKLVADAVSRDLSVLVEKPLCLDLGTGVALRAKLADGACRVMVGYMRRYDEAFLRLEQAATEVGPIRVVRTRTAETPASTYLRSLPIDEDLKADEDPSRVGQEDYSLLEERTGGSTLVARLYKNIILDSLVHELNMVQALGGQARTVAFAELSAAGACAQVRCERATAQLSWVATPGAARYLQEVQLLGSNGSASVRFDSPYLSTSAGQLLVEAGGPSLGATFQRNMGPSADSAFLLELSEFYAMATGLRQPKTPIDEALSDIALCEALGRAAVQGQEVRVDRLAAIGPIPNDELSS